TAAGQTGSILDGWTGFFNDGAMPGYIVDSPDVIAPAEGAVDIAEYVGAADSLIDSFDGLSGWKNPSYSGSTSADAGGTFTITGNPVRFGTGAGHLAYEWGPAGTFIRVFNSSLPAFSPDSDFSVWVYGDNSGHRVRFTIRDSEGEFFVNDYTTIDFSGWRRIVWEDVRNNSNRWAG